MNGRYQYPPALRLLRPAEFKTVFDSATFKIGQSHFLLLACPNGLDHARLGLVIAKKKVRLSVQRNRIKRITRDSFRHQQSGLPPVDLVMIARQNLDELDNPTLHQALQDAWRRLSRKFAKQAVQKPGSPPSPTADPESQP